MSENAICRCKDCGHPTDNSETGLCDLCLNHRREDENMRELREREQYEVMEIRSMTEEVINRRNENA